MAKTMSDHQNHFYDGLGLDLWRQAISPEDTLAEVDFLVEALDLDAPARLLDLPCGNGRHALPLAEEGFQVTGLDRSEAFLEEANRIGMARFFNGVARALVPGGRFVMESGNLAECLLPNFEERLWYPVGNLLVLMENSYDPAEGLLETNYTIIRDPGAPDGGNNGHAPFQPGRPQLEARHETRQLRQWIYSLSEIRHMLGEAGLGLAGFCADTDGAPFDMGCERVFIVAEKV